MVRWSPIVVFTSLHFLRCFGNEHGGHGHGEHSVIPATHAVTPAPVVTPATHAVTPAPVVTPAPHVAITVAPVPHAADHAVTTAPHAGEHGVTETAPHGEHEVTDVEEEGQDDLVTGHETVGDLIHEAEEVEQDLSALLLFAGGLFFFASMYCCTSSAFCGRDDGVRAFSWKWIGVTMSLFLAVLIWQPFNFIIVRHKRDVLRAGGSVGEAAAAVFSWSLGFTVLIILVYIVWMCLLNHCLHHLRSFLFVWGHCVGFALMNVIVSAQDFAVVMLPALHIGTLLVQALLVWAVVAVFVPLFLHLLQSCLFNTAAKKFYMRDEDAHNAHEREEESEEAHEILIEFTGESSALALSWTLLRVVVGCICGEMPDIFATTRVDKTFYDQLLLAILCIVISFGAGFYSLFEETLTKRMEKMCPRFAEVANAFWSSFFNMLAAFAWLQLIRWVVYSNGANVHQTKEDLVAHIFIAFAVSLGSLAVVPLLFLCPQGAVRTLFSDWVYVGALLAAFSWEMALDLLFELLNKEPSGDLPEPYAFFDGTYFFGVRCLTIMVIACLVCVLCPLFVCAVNPRVKYLDLQEVAAKGIEEDTEEGSTSALSQSQSQSSSSSLRRYD